MEFIPAKSIIQKMNYSDQWFGIDFNMNLYKGCCHGCIYCDSRSNCYGIDNFDIVRSKENAIEILNKELKNKRTNGVVGIGAMSDTYNPFEVKYEITKKALELLYHYGYGVSIDTKSDLIVRDIPIFQKIQEKNNCILKLTITTCDDKISKIIEPNVCVSSERFKAVKQLSDAGIFVGILFTPILPYITDGTENAIQMVKLAYESGAKFIYCMGGVTIRDNQRDYYFENLDKYFPGLKEKYIKNYRNNYMCMVQNSQFMNVFRQECKKYGLLYKMNDIIKAYKKETKIDYEQISLI